MGWRGFTRQVIAASRRAQRQSDASRRRSERESHRRQRELARSRKEWERLEAQQRAAAEYEYFTNAVAVLLSVHKECSAPVDWVSTAHAPAPSTPVYSNANETAATAQLASYKPGFFARLFGMEAKQRARLEASIEEGRTLDHQGFRAREEQYKNAYEAWAWHQQLAAAVLSGNLQAYETAISYFEPLEELEEQGCQIQLGTSDPWFITVELLAKDESIVPVEEKSLSASGKLSTKKMAAGKQREIYQDYVCGSALRCAREMLALLPVQFVLVHVSLVLLNKITGHHEPTTVLSVAFSRSGMDRLNVAALDPSDAMGNFVHRMGFKKSSGFSRIDPIQPQELQPERPGLSA